MGYDRNPLIGLNVAPGREVAPLVEMAWPPEFGKQGVKEQPDAQIVNVEAHLYVHGPHLVAQTDAQQLRPQVADKVRCKERPCLNLSTEVLLA